MILRKIIIPLFSALFILSFFSAVADTGRDTATDLAKAQDRTRSVEDRLGAIRTMGQSGDERHSDPLLRMLRDKGEDRRVRAGAVITLAESGRPRRKSLKPVKRYIGTVRPARTSAIRFFSPSAR